MSAAEFNDGGPVSPITEANGANSGMTGMSLRQHYIGLAMQPLFGESTRYESVDGIAGQAVLMADALIRAGHNPPQQLEKPFSPSALTNDECAAMDRLTSWNYFDYLPSDVRHAALATAAFLKSNEAGDSIPF